MTSFSPDDYTHMDGLRKKGCVSVLSAANKYVFVKWTLEEGDEKLRTSFQKLPNFPLETLREACPELALENTETLDGALDRIRPCLTKEQFSKEDQPRVKQTVRLLDEFATLYCRPFLSPSSARSWPINRPHHRAFHTSIPREPGPFRPLAALPHRLGSKVSFFDRFTPDFRRQLAFASYPRHQTPNFGRSVLTIRTLRGICTL